MVILGELNSSSDYQRVEGGQAQPRARKVGSNTPIPPKFIVPAPDPPKQYPQKSVKPIISEAPSKAHPAWIKKMQDTPQWEWDHLYMEWDLRELLNIGKVTIME
ncbi:hypothetical protein DCAR_0100985 [Daucus carota subsp. sativus]|uniref:Uncharacterized protein n=1 Tax=Daucus carota subsp. sativus TaxID=79200 RepID=A0A166G2S8_DAUCS|nr:PREDICTED: uncharacterized protein LOC108217559 [Daucus carota subsp. sativus]WOG81833.1 hypothetical protein DCAR_0100985 [Daucus carota subsp. sativus]